MPTILAIDDTAEILSYFRLLFEGTEYRIVTAADGSTGLHAFVETRPDVIFLDVNLPDISGLDMLKQLRDKDQWVPIVIMTGHSDPALIISAMQIGAFDFVTKPLGRETIFKLVRCALQQSQVGMVSDGEAAASADAEQGFLGRSRRMEDVYKSIGRIAATDASVLLLGESGTGKEMAARTIWQRSSRAHLPFVTVNCAALAETLLESELFGHEQGAFTGASKRHIGYFEQCDNGTLFLDEIGDMPLPTQSKLLRALQEQQFYRVGGEQCIQTSVRVIAATNRDLAALQLSGEFRKDLYYRLNTCAVRMPPLRDRADDIPMLAHHFLRQSNSRFQKLVNGFTREAMHALEKYDWPGNVRELQRAVIHAVLNTSGHLITDAALPHELIAYANARVGGETVPSDEIVHFIRDRLRDGNHHLYQDAISFVEKQLFREVMLFSKRNQSVAAKLLGLSRPTLRKKLQMYDVL
jgi:DNA-binding NtrC family response regulator